MAEALLGSNSTDEDLLLFEQRLDTKKEVESRVPTLAGSLAEIVELDLGDSNVDELIDDTPAGAGSSGS